MEARHQQILEMLTRQDSATVGQLSDAFGVSPVTIRADLNQLAKAGKIVRTHGGAHLSGERTRQELTYATRQKIQSIPKMQIARAAAALVTSQESIVLDSSTTAVAVGKVLKQRTNLHHITVVTTGIWTALELLGAPHIDVVLCGGHVRDTTGSITGSITNEVLSRFNFSRAFLGAWGISIEAGLTDANLAEVELKTMIIQRSKEIIAVVDSSKFGRTGLASFAPLADIAQIITDTAASPEIVAAITARGVPVHIAT